SGGRGCESDALVENGRRGHDDAQPSASAKSRARCKRRGADHPRLRLRAAADDAHTPERPLMTRRVASGQRRDGRSVEQRKKEKGKRKKETGTRKSERGKGR